MDILGIGPLELVVVLIIALLVFGPHRLPEIGGKLGKAMRDMRRATRALSAEIDQARQAIEEPAQEVARPFKDVAQAARQITEVANAVQKPGQALQNSISRAVFGLADETTPPDAMTAENTIVPPATALPVTDERDSTPASVSSSEPAASPVAAEDPAPRAEL